MRVFIALFKIITNSSSKIYKAPKYQYSQRILFKECLSYNQKKDLAGNKFK